MRSTRGELARAIARVEDEAREANDGRDRIDHIAAALLADDGFVPRLLDEHAAGWASGVSVDHAARLAASVLTHEAWQEGWDARAKYLGTDGDHWPGRNPYVEGPR